MNCIVPAKIQWAVFTSIALLALAIRLPRLSERPMHTDEAVNAYITGQLLEGNAYHYDPRDRHGPALYALAVPLARAARMHRYPDLTESILRLGPVIAGVIGVVLLSFTARRAGFLNAAVASALFAIGPIAVYFQRYFIHESLFVAATVGFLLSMWYATRETSRRIRWSAAAGVAAGLMIGCKETAILHFAAFAIAGVSAFGPRMWQKRRDVGSLISASSLLQQAFIMGVFFCAVVVLLYTWGGRHWQGLSDLVHSVPHSMSRAAGQGHEKPFAYYFGLLAGGWSGAPMLALATVGLANSFGTRRRFAVSETVAAETGAQEWFSFVAIYGLAIAVIYSAIPYKTPWLALNLWLPLSLLAGRGVSVIWEAAGRTAAKFSFAVALVFLAGALGRDSWQRAFVHPGGVGNPFAYAHTSEGFLDLPDRMAQLARERNLNDQIRIAVVATDPWPLPWYLRRFPQTGFWQPDQDPGVQDCYITMVDLPEPLRSRLEHWRPEFFELRPEVLVILWTLPPEDRP